MTITQHEIDFFIYLTSNAAYDRDLKDRYRKLGRKILRFIVQELGLQKGEYEIRWNPGGIACSGNHTLHTDKFYLALHDNLGFGSFYWRICQGRRDYTGGHNRNIQWTELKQKGFVPLLKQLRIAQDGQWKDPSSGDVILNVDRALRMETRI